jgi:hypothetical protein
MDLRGAVMDLATSRIITVITASIARPSIIKIIVMRCTVAITVLSGTIVAAVQGVTLCPTVNG